jgi:hypothetical protein
MLQHFLVSLLKQDVILKGTISSSGSMELTPLSFAGEGISQPEVPNTLISQVGSMAWTPRVSHLIPTSPVTFPLVLHQA